jgi:cysteinyl-tRNA synthetase
MTPPTIRFYNTFSHRIEPFESIEPGKVSMYNCGPTVYDYAHIGNFKTFVFADVLRRFLELVGYDVHQVMNLTDVGHMTDDALADGGGQDKMAAAAARLKKAKKEQKKGGQHHLDAIENPDDPYQVAQFYIDAFLNDAKLLGLKVADECPQNMPRATDHVKHMLEMIGRLIERGHAYVASDGAAYFSVQSFEHYGKLSGNTLDQLRGGAGGRIQIEHQQVKRHPADFLLWKPDPSHLMKWDPGNSAWGLKGPVSQLSEGYPGWHIECSAMAAAVLGCDIIDIHTGGEDNIFPHHECEIAQSCGATGKPTFARYWMHSRHLFVEGAKMSKSKGNFFTVRQVLDGEMTGNVVDPAVLRFELLKANYRSQMNVSKQGLLDSASAVRKLREFAQRVDYQPSVTSKTQHPDTVLTPVSKFIEMLADDLNIAGALAVVFEFVADPPGDRQQVHAALQAFDRVLGVLPSQASTSPQDDAIQQRCRDLDAARSRKDFAAADVIRADLTAAGYDVKTTKEGTVAVKRLA